MIPRTLTRSLIRSSAVRSHRPVQFRPFSSGPPPSAPTRRPFFSRLFFGGFSLAGLYFAYQLADAQKAQKKQLNLPVVSRLEDLMPLEVPSSWPEFLQNSSIVLYQYQTCPFCNKIRAYLDYLNIPYKIIEVSPLWKPELYFTSYRKVPVLVVNGVEMRESTVILRKLDEFLRYIPGSPIKEKISADWFGSNDSALNSIDTRLVQLTAPNLYRSLEESIESFKYIDEQSQFPATTRILNKYIGAVTMYLLSTYVLKKRNHIENPREEIFDFLKNTWMARHVRPSEGRLFHGGNLPSLSDISAFGVIRALMGFQVGTDLLNPSNTSPEFLAWYKRMNQIVGPGKGQSQVKNSTGADFKIPE